MIFLLKNYLNEDCIFLFWKGRVALYAILKALDIKEGDEVILPAFTCVVVPNPIIYLGAKPVYVDIDRKTFNIDISKIEQKITPKTKVIIAQNTFGLSSDLDPIIEIAKKYNLYVVEDCAHGFGGTYKGKKNGTIADAAFFSTQWNKPFSTGLGGIAVTKHEWLGKKLLEIEKRAITPSFKEVFLLRTLYIAREYLVNDTTYWNALKIYRFLSEKNLILGSSQGYELEKPIEPHDFLKGFSEFQAKLALKFFKKNKKGIYLIDELINHRKKIAKLYNQILRDLDIEPPYKPYYANHTYLKYPLLVKDRKKIFTIAEKFKVPLGDWFLSPIHPILTNFENWYYNYGENPIAEFASRHIINLPTDIDENKIDKVSDFLRFIKEKGEIIGCQVPSKLEE